MHAREFLNTRLRNVGRVDVRSSLDTVVLGIDQSLTATGVCVISPLGEVAVGEIGFKPGPDRQLRIYRFFGQLFQEVCPDLAAIEGYAFSKQGAQALGELGGIIRLCAQLCKAPLSVHSPSALKLFVTGKGNAPKEVVLLKLFQSFGLDAATNNEADAISLALMELTKAGKLNVSKARQEAASRAEEGEDGVPAQSKRKAGGSRRAA